MTPKKYKLLQDINSPDLVAKKGDIGIIEQAVAGDLKVWFDDSRYYFWLSTVVGNPDWFQEVKEPERIEVTNLRVRDLKNLWLEYTFSANEISPEKFPAIKKAIEQVLNGEYDPDKAVSEEPRCHIRDTPEYIAGSVNVLKNDGYVYPRLYTQSEYDKAIEDAFEAARSGDIVPPELGSGLAFGFKHTYPIFKDYQAAIKK